MVVGHQKQAFLYYLSLTENTAFLCGGSGVSEIVHFNLGLLPPDLNLRQLFSFESALAAFLFMQDIIFSSLIISLGTFFISAGNAGQHCSLVGLN